MSFHFLDGVVHTAGKVAHGDQKAGGGAFGFLRNQLLPNDQQLHAKFQEAKAAPAHIVQGVASQAAQLGISGESLVAKGLNKPQTPYVLPQNLPGGTKLFGSQPIESLQQHHSIKRETSGPVLSFLATAGVGGLDALNALPAAGPAVKGGARGVQAVNETKNAILAPRIALKDQQVLRDYNDYLTGANPASGKGELTKLISDARVVGQKHGVDLSANATRESRITATADLLDSVGKNRSEVGAVGRDVLGDGNKPNIADQLVHAKNPKDATKMLVEGGVDPVIAQRIAPAVVHTKDPNIINNIIDKAHQPPPTPEDIMAARTPALPEVPIDSGPPIELPKPLPIHERAFISKRGEISRAGLHGQELADRIHEARNASEIGQGQFVQKVKTALNLNKSEFEHFVNSLEELDKGATKIDAGPKVMQAIKEHSQNIQSLRDRLEAAGQPVGDLGKYYFPKNYTELLKSDEGINKAAQHLVDTKQAENLGEAAQMLQNMKRKYSTPFGHFENSRKLDLPDYDKSKNGYISYIQGAHNYIGAVEQLGPRGQIAKELIAKAGAEGHDVIKLLDDFQVATGVKKYNPTAENFSSKVRGFQRFRALGLSSLLNATQSTNTASVAGILRTAKSATELLSPAQQQYVKDSAVVIDSVLNDLREGGGVGKTAFGKATAPGFGLVERFNRSVAAVSGRNYGNSLAAKGDAKSLAILKDKLGVKGNIGKKLTYDQEIQAGRGMVELTQFKVDPQDLPGWTSSPGGKLVAQFRTFSYKQTGFIYNELLKEAVKGNVLPLARFMAVGIPLGVASGAARNALRGQPGAAAHGNQESGESNLFHTAMEGLANIGAFGLGPGDAKFAIQNRKSTRLPEYVAGSLGGPTAGLGVGVVQDIQQAASGNLAAIERRGLKSLSSVGPALSNKLLPYDGLNKDEKGTLSDLKKQGAPQKQIDSYKTFFGTKPPTATKVKDHIDKALLANDFDKATKLAKDYNTQVEKAYAGWARKYGDDVPDDLYNRYTNKYINPDSFDARLEHLQTPILNR